MNKFFGIVMLAVIGVTLATAPLDDKAKTDHMNGLIMECQKSEGTSDADVMALRKKMPPTSKEAKCLVGCMFEKMTVFVNGKFSKENANKVCQEMFKNNPEMLKKSATAHQNCEPVALAGGVDKCVNGPVLQDCIQKNMPEFVMFPAQ